MNSGGGGGGGGVPITPLKTIYDFDDFLSAEIEPPAPKLGWVTVSNGWENSPGTASNPGIIFNGNSFGASDAICQPLDSPSANPFLLGGSELTINWVVDIGTLSNGTDRYIDYIGLTDSNKTDLMGSVTQPLNGCFFKYSDNLNSGNWQIICGNAGVYTTVNTATPAAVGFHNYGIHINSAGTIATFTINGVIVGTVTTNLPTVVQIGPAILIEHISGTMPFLYIDLYYYVQILNTARPGIQDFWPGSTGSGDVIGPNFSTDNALARFDGTTGKLIKNSVGILSNAGDLSGLASIAANFTPYSVITGGTTPTGPLQNVASVGTAGQTLISNGAAMLPSFGTLGIAGGGTNATSMSTSTGIVKYDGTSLVTSSTALIDINGRMTNSAQPAFSAYLPTDDANVTGDATFYVIGSVTAVTKIFDNTNSLNTNGTFTAPVTGKYFLRMTSQLNTITTSTNLQARIICTSQSFQGVLVNPLGIVLGGSLIVTADAIVSMTAGDTATFNVLAAGGAGTKTVGVSGGTGPYITFIQGLLLVA